MFNRNINGYGPMGQTDQANNMDCTWVWITVKDQRDSAICSLVVMAILLWTGTHIYTVQ